MEQYIDPKMEIIYFDSDIRTDDDEMEILTSGDL